MGLKPNQVRHYVRRDLLQPLRGRRGEYRFSFQDVVMLRSAKELLDAQVPVRKTNRILLDLKARSSGSRPLSSVRVQAEGSRVLVRDGNVSWDAETGQGNLALPAEAPANTPGPDLGAVDNVATLTPGEAPITVRELHELSSDDWYNLALDLEEADPKRAPEAYRRAIALDSSNADALVNLGRLFQLKGNLKQARSQYQQALDVQPDHQLANYNMGTIFDELDQHATATRYYLKAHRIPDAHYNLARLYEVSGNELAALRHMREYRRLREDSSR